MEEEKQQSYVQSEAICERILKYDMLIIMGDFNTKIGKESYLAEVTGGSTILEYNNGTRLYNLAVAENLHVVSRSQEEHGGTKSTIY